GEPDERTFEPPGPVAPGLTRRPTSGHLLESLIDRYAEPGGIELDLPPRAAPARAAASPPVVVLDTNVVAELMRRSPAPVGPRVAASASERGVVHGGDHGRKANGNGS